MKRTCIAPKLGSTFKLNMDQKELTIALQRNPFCYLDHTATNYPTFSSLGEKPLSRRSRAHQGQITVTGHKILPVQAWCASEFSD